MSPLQADGRPPTPCPFPRILYIIYIFLDISAFLNKVYLKSLFLLHCLLLNDVKVIIVLFEIHLVKIFVEHPGEVYWQPLVELNS